jgi:predicted transcriptional regulator
LTSGAGVSELAVLQAVRLKGRVGLAALADTLRADPAAVSHVVERLTETGLLVRDKTVRLSGQGRTRLAELLAAERRHVDQEALAKAYRAFGNVNAELKAAVTDWQLKGGELNSHDDADYDAAIVARIDTVHRTVSPTLAAVAAQLPRLSGYSVKLQQALDRVKAGDTSWLTRPIVDSYHTVWFELHEELIDAVGLTREAEARSGRA